MRRGEGRERDRESAKRGGGGGRKGEARRQRP